MINPKKPELDRERHSRISETWKFNIFGPEHSIFQGPRDLIFFDLQIQYFPNPDIKYFLYPKIQYFSDLKIQNFLYPKIQYFPDPEI